MATWWLVGDQSTVPASADPDFAVEPFDIAPGLQRAAGIGSTVLAIAALPTLIWATRRGRLSRRWWPVLAPLLVAGAAAGFGWRILTAGVIGANIGAGMVILVVGPVIAGLLIWSLAYAIRLLLSRFRAQVTGG